MSLGPGVDEGRVLQKEKALLEERSALAHLRSARRRVMSSLGAAHRVATIQALITSAIADRDVTTAVTHRSIPHHLAKLLIERTARC